MTIKSQVRDVKLPATNVYYEKDSIDGYAFLGIARALMGLDTSEVESIMNEKVYGLNAPYNIQGTPLPPDTIYAYSCYPCYEFYNLKNNKTRTTDIIQWLTKRIGVYKDVGMMRYCNHETGYLVPNVTPLTALMYLKHGGDDLRGKAKNLMLTMAKRQEKNGNWRYYLNGEPGRQEDSMHVGMILCGLRGVKELMPMPELDSTISKAVAGLYEMNRGMLQTGTVGWNPPFVAVATHGLRAYKDLYDRAYIKTKKQTIHNSNFRVRAISAWALALIDSKDNPRT